MMGFGLCAVTERSGEFREERPKCPLNGRRAVGRHRDDIESRERRRRGPRDPLDRGRAGRQLEKGKVKLGV
jgi:hypothetical protein